MCFDVYVSMCQCVRAYVVDGKCKGMCVRKVCVCVCVGGFVCMKESMCVSENVSVFAFLESTCTLFVVL